ncbi:MAG: DUF882 domain-containing protein [Bacteroidetes bacterium]|nr:DUF882 domain-containing protein [Bacteroidota bacterium]
MKLSAHFTLEELTRSDYAIRNGIENKPNEEQVHNLQMLCEHALEPLREIVKKPIIVTSGFRSEKVNTAIGGSTNSQHTQGKAADIHVSGMTIDELFMIARKFVPYDQLIQEFNQWVHISWTLPLRRQPLLALKEEGKTIYKSFEEKNFA